MDLRFFVAYFHVMKELNLGTENIGSLILLRDVVIFVPASIIIATLSKSIVTMLWAAVISDVIAAIIGFMFVQSEIMRCERLIEK